MSRTLLAVVSTLLVACGPDTPESLTALTIAAVQMVMIPGEPPPVAIGETRQLKAVARLTDDPSTM